jgi:hypothetical protein
MGGNVDTKLKQLKVVNVYMEQFYVKESKLCDTIMSFKEQVFKDIIVAEKLIQARLDQKKAYIARTADVAIQVIR